jgi:tetratricopeptide (TPR) repeat protein
VTFAPDGRGLLTAMDSLEEPGGSQGKGAIQLWDLAVGRPTEQVLLLSRLHSAHRTDGEDVVPLSAGELRSAWLTLQTKYPDVLTTKPADVLAWHRRQAELCRQPQRPGKKSLHRAAVHHRTRLIEAEPAEWEHRAWRGFAHAELAEWKAAARDYAAALEAGADQEWCWFHLALIRLDRDDLAGYRAVRSSLLKRFPVKPSSGNYWHLTCLMAPGNADDIADSLRALRSAAQSNPRDASHTLLGLALYRSGDFAEAVKQLNKVVQLQGSSPGVVELCYLAMAQKRSGQDAQAARSLKNAGDRRRAEDLRLQLELAKVPHDVAPAWYDRLFKRQTLREAERVVEGETP